MKYIILSLLALTGMFFSSCAIEETPSGEGSILAVMVSDDTRTAVTDEGKFTWSSGDQIWLHTTSGGIVGTLSSGSGTSSANFTYGYYIGEMTGKAVCPYNAGHSISGDVLNVTMPASYDLGSSIDNTNAAMYGVNEGGTLKFNHMAGVMRFKFNNVPAGVNRFTITLDKKINGTFHADLTADYPIIETGVASTASEKTIILNFDPLTSPSDISLYVPLPVGTYTSLELGLYDNGQSVWKYSNVVTNKVNRKSLILMPSVTLSGSIGGDIENGEGDFQECDYVDEYGVNYGQGVKIGKTIWAPVNCGYHATDYKYGKLYQWGRKYGQGYFGSLYDIDGNSNGKYSDATTPELIEGPVSLEEGQSEDNIGKFYYNSVGPFCWESTQDCTLWNSGTEDIPVKTEYDPCPKGWRVPTSAELSELSQNKSSWTTNEDGQIGYWFSGTASYSTDVPQVFFPAAGNIFFSAGSASARGRDGYYWSSSVAGNFARGFDFTSTDVVLDTDARARGYSVRCVQEQESVDESVQEVMITCVLMGNSGGRSIGLDDAAPYLTGDDFVDVNGIIYPVKGDGTNKFVVKVPRAESYTISYPANSMKLMSDGTYAVHMPNKYVGSTVGVFIGTIDDTSTCNLQIISGLAKLDVSAYEDWDRVEFKANCGTALWGDAVVQSDYSVSTLSNGDSVVTLTRSGDDQYAYIPFLPCSITGITVTLYNKSGEVIIERKSNNVLNFTRGRMVLVRM